VFFEGVRAVDNVDLGLAQGEILGLIGPNGAGKTTFVNVITGFQRPTHGTVTLGGRDITRLPPDARVRLGIARTFQGGRLFRHMTTLENVQLGAVGRGEPLKRAAGVARELLDRLGVAHLANEPAHILPHGEERLVGIARALATQPRFLLLDEPAAGLNDTESGKLADTLRVIRDELQLGVLLIEHDVQLVLTLCDRVQVLDEGKTLAVGPPDQIRADERVITAYLGTHGDKPDA
jgi:branched-chain amino acid transport system ATP-binding protein